MSTGYVEVKKGKPEKKLDFFILRWNSTADYSLVRLVVPNTKELIPRPLEGLLKIRLLFQDGMRSTEFRN